MTGERVMIVDDNRSFLSEIRDTLRLCGYDAKAVCNSKNAVRLARSLKPSVILLDLKMGGTNGFQVAQELRDSQETSAIPIIAMSGYFPVEQPSALLDLSNTVASIKKPFSVLDLIDKIEAALSKA